jgi:hypothetical protein
MGLSRSTFYDKPSSPADNAAIVAAMIEICDEFESYGYRRVGAELRSSRHGRQFQEGPLTDARAPPAAQAP